MNPTTQLKKRIEEMLNKLWADDYGDVRYSSSLPSDWYEKEEKEQFIKDLEALFNTEIERVIGEDESEGILRIGPHVESRIRNALRSEQRNRLKEGGKC